MSTSSIGQVLSCSPEAIVVLIEDLKTFEEHKAVLQVGRYLRIAQGNNDFTVASIRNMRGVLGQDADGKPKWQFHIECQAVGTLVDDKTFERASVLLPVPTEPAFPADKDTMDKLFAENADYQFPLGQLSLNKATAMKLHGDRFFSKHVAIVGSTGSGKSCAVARILHDVVGIADEKNSNISTQNNSHVVIFDIHDEYTAAFSLQEEQKFTLNRLDIDSLKLPYWLMNSEELESMFIESNEQNSHNQVSQFKQAVRAGFRKLDRGISDNLA
ncbi:MAG: ATP-binding protein [Acidobacteria bacterium]|nr:ATP-binding protein [Acidobacteriota bacterium]